MQSADAVEPEHHRTLVPHNRNSPRSGHHASAGKRAASAFQRSYTAGLATAVPVMFTGARIAPTGVDTKPTFAGLRGRAGHAQAFKLRCRSKSEHTKAFVLLNTHEESGSAII